LISHLAVITSMADHMFLLYIVIFIPGLVLAKTVQVTEGVFAFDLGAAEIPYTSLFVVTGSGVMVVDPINTNTATAMLQEIRRVTSEPIKYVFYSHDHWDHTSGGQVFKDEGAEIIAHEDAAAWIRANTGPDQIPADTTWSGNKKVFRLGRLAMELYQFGASHGNGMTIFLVSSQPRVAYVADLAAVKSTGPFFLPEFDTVGWERTLEKTLGLNFAKAVFTHSPPEGGTKQDIADHLGYIKDIRAGVRDELRKGTSPFAIPGTLRLDKYKDWAGYEQQFPLNVFHFVVEEAVLGPYAKPINKNNSPARSVCDGVAKWRFKAGYNTV